MKALLAEVAIVLAEVLAVVGILYLAYKKFLAPVLPTGAEVKQGLADISTGLPSALGSIARGETASGYMTSDQQAANAAANLAAHNAMVGT